MLVLVVLNLKKRSFENQSYSNKLFLLWSELVGIEYILEMRDCVLPKE